MGGMGGQYGQGPTMHRTQWPPSGKPMSKPPMITHVKYNSHNTTRAGKTGLGTDRHRFLGTRGKRRENV